MTECYGLYSRDMLYTTAMTSKYRDDKELITPERALSRQMIERAESFPITDFIMVFSSRLIHHLLDVSMIEVLDPILSLGCAAYSFPVYRICGTSTGMILSGIGGPAAAASAEELRVLFPLKHLILFGSCGTLTDLPESQLIIPDKAYRDEGTSFHYAEPSRYITIPNAERLRVIFEQLHIPAICGGTWTTDAFYRETVQKRNQLVREGCICVEMECAGLQAFCDYRGIEFFPFFYSADTLHEDWFRRTLGTKEADASFAAFTAARAAAEVLQNKSQNPE